MHTRSTRAPREWQRHIEGWQQSGLSQRVYCREQGLALSTFQLWKRRLRSRSTSTALEIVPVPMSPPVSAAPRIPAVESPIAVVLGGSRYSVELRAGFNASALRQVLNVLEER